MNMEKHMDYDQIERSARVRKSLGNVVLYALLTLWAIMVLVPF